MIRICKQISEVEQYKKYSRLKSGSGFIPLLTINNSIFMEARDMFAAGHVLAEVRNACGDEVLFYLRPEQDMASMKEGFIIDININFDKKGLLEEENLETCLLQKADSFLFEELEEYTYALTEFIRNQYPEKPIFYLDEHAKYFWSGITILEHFEDINTYKCGRYMYIRSDTRWYVDDENRLLNYNSYNIVNSLCWAKKVNCLGTKNNGQTILLIDPEFSTGYGLSVALPVWHTKGAGFR